MRQAASLFLFIASFGPLMSQTTVTTPGGGGSALAKFTSAGGSTILPSAIVEEPGGTVDFGVAFDLAHINMIAPPLGPTPGDVTNVLSLQDIDGDFNEFRFYQKRVPLPAGWPSILSVGWYTAASRLQDFTNGVAQGYLEFNPQGAPDGLALGDSDTEYMRLIGNENVGIGTKAPTSRLEVNGNVTLTAGSGASLTFPDGTVQSTAYTGTCVATGGDYAESVDVSGIRSEYEPGDVMVIDPDNPEHFLKSSQPYSTLVAGIYSTKPGYIGRRQTGDPKLAKTEVPMAMIGIVPMKVTTENGPIKVGDLLVTSSRSGYAMKGTDRNLISGAIVGKALAKLDSEAGTIQALVSLQ